MLILHNVLVISTLIQLKLVLIFEVNVFLIEAVIILLAALIISVSVELQLFNGLFKNDDSGAMVVLEGEDFLSFLVDKVLVFILAFFKLLLDILEVFILVILKIL